MRKNMSFFVVSLLFSFFIVSCSVSINPIRTKIIQQEKTKTEKQAFYEIFKKQRERFNELDKEYKAMGRFFNLIETEYYRYVSPEEMEEVIYEGINAMLKKLDRYSCLRNVDSFVDAGSAEKGSQIKTKFFENSKIGYIFLESFLLIGDEDLSEKFAEELKKMKGLSMRGLIVDLRNNPGGYVTLVRPMCEEFLLKDVLITRTSKLKGLIKEDFRSRENNLCKYPIIILVNKRTASAAELFAGVLQYHKVAKLMGQNTYGKGTLLRLASIGKKEAFFVFGECFLPSGESVEGKGLKPDIELNEEITNSDKIIELAVKELQKQISAK